MYIYTFSTSIHVSTCTFMYLDLCTTEIQVLDNWQVCTLIPISGDQNTM